MDEVGEFIDYIEDKKLDMRVIKDRIKVTDYVINNFNMVPRVLQYHMNVTEQAIAVQDWAKISDEEAITIAEHMSDRMLPVQV